MTTDQQLNAKFRLGRLFMTSGVAELELNLLPLLLRHMQGDWGEVCREDKAANEEALIKGWRVMSVYKVEGHTIWIITEADRSVTTALLPSEY